MLRAAKELRHATLTAPTSPWTWETRVQLLGGQTETARVPVELRQPCQIVAFIPTIYVLRPRVLGLEDPSLSDLEVNILVDQQDQLSNQANGTTTSEDPFVTLGSWSIMTPRLVCAILPAANPALSLQFRWKQDPNNNQNPGPFFNSIEIGFGYVPNFRIDEEG